MDSRGLLGWNLPVAFKSTKVVEADDVAGSQRPGHALHPPLITGLAGGFPAVKRISPELACTAERVRRNAGHHRGLEFVVKIKELGMAPHVGTVIVHKDGNVTNYLDAAF